MQKQIRKHCLRQLSNCRGPPCLQGKKLFQVPSQLHGRYASTKLMLTSGSKPHWHKTHHEDEVTDCTTDAVMYATHSEAKIALSRYWAFWGPPSSPPYAFLLQKSSKTQAIAHAVNTETLNAKEDAGTMKPPCLYVPKKSANVDLPWHP